jgi:hypothetical protein
MCINFLECVKAGGAARRRLFIRSRISPPPMPPVVAPQEIASRSQQSRVKAMLPRSPLSETVLYRAASGSSDDFRPKTNIGERVVVERHQVAIGLLAAELHEGFPKGGNESTRH